MKLQALTTNHVYPVFGFLGFFSTVILMPMHFRAKDLNVGVLLFVVWTSILCLVFSVNSIVWNNSMADVAPAWCDISSRLITASTTGNQTALLCIVRCLYRIVTMKVMNQSSSEVRIDLLINLSLGIGTPLLLLVFQYIVVSHRYVILEDIGCFPAIAVTTLGIPLYRIWPIIIALVSSVYAGLTVYVTIQRRARSRNIIDGQYPQRYWRLLSLCGIGIICALPDALLSLILGFFHITTPYT
ncbi:hypothetical protein SERLADRAFT_449243, partial [Serpula lacrymans var. lacrymans S7.9]